MIKNYEKRMVNIAERAIRGFVEEWKKNPYLWESETDVHAERYSKIKSSLNKPIECKYEGYMEDDEKFSWIYCKPKIYIKGKTNYYYPDIVIYKKGLRARKVGKRENEPMLWVCEIKYVTEWSSMLSRANVKNDIFKLKCLLKQKDDRIKGTDYACCLILKRCKQEKGRYRKIKKSVQFSRNQPLKTEESPDGKFKQYFYSIYYEK